MLDQFANASIQTFKPILDSRDADWQDTIDVNLTGTCNAIRAASGQERRRTHHRHLIHARPARHKIWRRLFRVQMGHHRPHEIGGARARHP
jgi:NAD(P)-dependent dehydrogenase (short-subunit alcohol dehydrogenase family)